MACENVLVQGKLTSDTDFSFKAITSSIDGRRGSSRIKKISATLPGLTKKAELYFSY